MLMMLAVFLSCYAVVASLFGFFHPGAFALSGAMLIVSVGLFLYYLDRSWKEEAKGDAMNAGDFLLASGASVFSLAVTSGTHNPWLLIPAGMLILSISVIWVQNFKRRSIECIWDAYVFTIACQFLAPAPVYLAAFAGSWNWAVLLGIAVVWIVGAFLAEKNAGGNGFFANLGEMDDHPDLYS